MKLKRLLSGALARLLVLLLALGAAELLLRLIGYQPLGGAVVDHTIGLVLPDDKLGWRLKPGVFDSQAAGERGPLLVSIRKPGVRIAAEQRGTFAGPPVLLLGGSYVMGTGLYDDEALGWRLQELLPQREVLNFGTLGYGTCQSVLLLRELLQPPGAYRGAWVIYGFPPFHEMRNTANPAWLWRLALASNSRSAKYPFCSWEEGAAVKFHPPQRFEPYFPGLIAKLSLGTLAADAYYTQAAKQLVRRRRPITEQLLREADQLVRAAGGSFIVLLQDHDRAARQHYREFLEQASIQFIDGTHAEQELPPMRARDGAHPGAQLVQLWAESIAARIGSSKLAGSS